MKLKFRTSKAGEGPRAAPDKPLRVQRSPEPARGSGFSGGITAFALGVLVGLGALLADSLSRPGGVRLGPAVGSHAPGHAATRPSEIPLKGWWRIFERAFKEFNNDQIPAVAAGITFYGLLAMFPAVGAFVSLYGLFANVDDARRQVVGLSGILPNGAVSVIGDQMTRLASASHGRLGAAFLVSLLLSIWSSNAGIKALFAGLNVAYEETERRKFFLLNAVSLTFTVGVTVFAIIAVSAVVAVPAALSMLGVSGVSGVSLLRWPVLLLVVAGLVSLLYRYGPCRGRARWRWITPGGLVAALGWMIMSFLFSWYVSNFGNYDRTYGPLGAVIGFMTWIWLSMIVVLFGAELNSELELQIGVDARTEP